MAVLDSTCIESNASSLHIFVIIYTIRNHRLTSFVSRAIALKLKQKMLDKDSLDYPRRAVNSGSILSSKAYAPVLIDIAAIQDTSELVRATNDAMRRRRQSQWAPNTHQLLIMGTLSIISFMVALDSCIITTSLTVSIVSLSYII